MPDLFLFIPLWCDTLPAIFSPAHGNLSALAVIIISAVSAVVCTRLSTYHLQSTNWFRSEEGVFASSKTGKQPKVEHATPAMQHEHAALLAHDEQQDPIVPNPLTVRMGKHSHLSKRSAKGKRSVD